MFPSSLPLDYHRVKCVSNFHELVTTPFADGVNALCWERSLPGDFGEVVACLGVVNGIMNLDDDRLLALAVSAEGRVAIEVLREDQRRLREHGLSPELNCIQAYPRDEDAEVIATDVYSFHADSAPVPAETYLCTYYGRPSEGLRNEEAQRRVSRAETRAQLLEQFGGGDDEAFEEFLRENCYDLHYAAMPGAQPYSFGLGHLWRIAIDHPDCPVPPCIHRAPETLAGDRPRLLLIS